MGFGWTRHGRGGTRQQRPARLTRIALVGGSEAPSLHLLPQSEACGLAFLIFSQKWTAVWCGMGTGIAGHIVEHLLDAGGSAEAVLVRGREPSDVHGRASRAYVDGFHARTAALFGTEAVIVVPGGAGTLAELALFSAWKQACLWNGRIVVLDPSDWFRPFRSFSEQCAERQVARPLEEHVRFVQSYAEIPAALGVRTAARRNPTDFLLRVRCVEEAPAGLPEPVSGPMRPVGANASYFSTLEMQPAKISRLSSRSDWWGLFGGSNAFVAASVTTSALALSALALAAGASEERRTAVEQAWTDVRGIQLPPLPPQVAVPSNLAAVGLARFAILMGACRDESTAIRVLNVFEPLVKAAGMEIEGAQIIIAVHRTDTVDDGTHATWPVFRAAIRRLLGLSPAENPRQPWEPGEPAAHFFKEVAYSRRRDSDMGYVEFFATAELTPFDSTIGIVAAFMLHARRTVANQARRQLTTWLAADDTAQHIGASSREILRIVLLRPTGSSVSNDHALRVLDVLSRAASLAYAATVSLIGDHHSATSTSWLAAFARYPLTSACLYPGAHDNNASLVHLVPFWDAAFRIGRFIEDHPDATIQIPQAPGAPCGWDQDHPDSASLAWFWEWASQGNAHLTAELRHPIQRVRTRLEDAALLGICLGGWDVALQGLAYSQLSPPLKAALPYVRPDTFNRSLLQITHQRLAMDDPAAAQMFNLATALAMVVDSTYVSTTHLNSALNALLESAARPTIPFVVLERLAPALRGNGADHGRLIARCVAPVTDPQREFAEAMGAHGTRIAPVLARDGHADNVGGATIIAGTRYGFFVDRKCCLCSMCSAAAPQHFRMGDDETQSICFQQPIDEAELVACLTAAEQCPTEAIRMDGF
jgi:predicted Rossmann-fold nucleotide-binding protein/ferredoxin